MQHHDTELALNIERWYRVLNAHPEARNHPNRHFFPSDIKLTKYQKDPSWKKMPTSRNFYMDDSANVCQWKWVRDMEVLLVAKELGKLIIEKLLPDDTNPLDYNQLLD